MRGRIYQSAIEHFGRLCEGGVPRLLAELDELDDEGVRSFFRQKFSPTAWYDMLPVIPLISAASRASGLPALKVAREVARAQSIRDLGGLSKMMLKLASPDLVVGRLPAVSKLSFDFGAARLLDPMPGQVIFLRTGVPACVVPWYCALTEGFVGTTLERAGGKDVQVTAKMPERDGDCGGIETVTIPFQVRWR